MFPIGDCAGVKAAGVNVARWTRPPTGCIVPPSLATDIPGVLRAWTACPWMIRRRPVVDLRLISRWRNDAPRSRAAGTACWMMPPSPLPRLEMMLPKIEPSWMIKKNLHGHKLGERTRY